MSMTLDERRTEVLSVTSAYGCGKLRLTKASSRYDKRRRYYAVEYLPQKYVGHELEDHFWQVIRDWPVAEGMPAEFWNGARKMLYALSLTEHGA